MRVKKLNKPVFRFAPSPNGYLHLGHAFSAIVNYEMAKDFGGKFLLRMENIDLTRCSIEFEAAIKEDLAWLGLEWEDSVLRQSDHFHFYDEALSKLKEMGVIYAAVLTRKEIKEFALKSSEAKKWPCDPDGAPIYPPEEEVISVKERERRLESGQNKAWRLDMPRAVEMIAGNLKWQELQDGYSGKTSSIAANLLDWGDVVLARKDTPTSYHLSVVIDDSLQGITDIVRGKDLYWSTSVHRLLQELLELPEPRYFHHSLVLDDAGRKLSKCNKDTSIRQLRQNGATVMEIRKMIGLG